MLSEKISKVNKIRHILFEELVQIQEVTMADDLPHERREQSQEHVQVEVEEEVLSLPDDLEEPDQNAEPIAQDEENKDLASEVPVQVHIMFFLPIGRDSIPIIRKKKKVCHNKLQ